MNLDVTGFTKTHMALLRILADGEPHTREELRTCLDELANEKALNRHFIAMRKLLRPQGQTILCVSRHRQIHYCWVQLCPPAYAVFMDRKRRPVNTGISGPVF